MECIGVITQGTGSKGPRSERLARGNLCFHVGQPALLVHQEASQVVLVALDPLHFSVEHQVEVDFVPFERLAHLIPREDLVRLRGWVVRVQTEHWA